MDRAHIVAASAPIPRSARPSARARHPMAVDEVTTVVAKGHQGSHQGGRQGRHGRVTMSTRLAASSKDHDVWTRALILTPSASRTMSSSILGEPDMTAMAVHFVKPPTAVAMTFSSDPQPGLICDRFTGPAISAVPVMAFASLR